MKKKWAFSFLFLLGILTPLFIWISKNPQEKVPTQKTQHVKCKCGPYFFPVPISKFTTANQPCLSAQINGNIVPVMLDLGFRGQFSFSSQFLKDIENKAYLGSKKMYGILGVGYEQALYRVPEVTIGSITFLGPTLHEYAEKFHTDSILIKGNNEFSSPEPGKIGWELFGNTNLFLDLKNSKIAFCDSLATLKGHGYAIENFTKTPLLLGRGLVEFKAETSERPLLCMLDTGSTWNILNIDTGNETSIDQLALESGNVVDYALFKINADDFGPITFHLVPIKIPIRIDAILGMDFFEKYLVFLDFYENQAYFSKN